MSSNFTKAIFWPFFVVISRISVIVPPPIAKAVKGSGFNEALQRFSIDYTRIYFTKEIFQAVKLTVQLAGTQDFFNGTGTDIFYGSHAKADGTYRRVRFRCNGKLDK